VRSPCIGEASPEVRRESPPAQPRSFPGMPGRRAALRMTTSRKRVSVTEWRPAPWSTRKEFVPASDPRHPAAMGTASLHTPRRLHPRSATQRSRPTLRRGPAQPPAPGHPCCCPCFCRTVQGSGGRDCIQEMLRHRASPVLASIPGRPSIQRLRSANAAPSAPGLPSPT
jgi:hypothetical protein